MTQQNQGISLGKHHIRQCSKYSFKKASNATPKIYRCLNCWIGYECMPRKDPWGSNGQPWNQEFMLSTSKVWWEVLRGARSHMGKEMEGAGDLLLAQFVTGSDVRQRNTGMCRASCWRALPCPNMLCGLLVAVSPVWEPQGRGLSVWCPQGRHSASWKALSEHTDKQVKGLMSQDPCESEYHPYFSVATSFWRPVWGGTEKGV